MYIGWISIRCSHIKLRMNQMLTKHQALILSPILWEHSINRKVENMIAVTLGEKVAQYRKDRKWSQEDLEEYSGISVTQISRIERDVVVPSWITVRKIEKAFGLPYGSLFFKFDPDDDKEGIVHEIGMRLTASDLNKDQMIKIATIIDMIVGIAKETK